MARRPAPIDPDEAARRLAARLEEAILPAFVSAEHDAELDVLKVTWAHGITLYMDLTREDFMEPIDAHGRAVVLGLRPCCEACARLAESGSPGNRGRPHLHRVNMRRTC